LRKAVKFYPIFAPGKEQKEVQVVGVKLLEDLQVGGALWIASPTKRLADSNLERQFDGVSAQVKACVESLFGS
jgi:hypothetical protein